MKVKFSKPKGQRIFKGTVKIPGKTKRFPMFLGLENMDDNYLMWSDELGKWVGRHNRPDGEYSLCSMSKPIRSVKAAIRHIRKHNEIPNGAKMVLMSNFDGYDVEIIK